MKHAPRIECTRLNPTYTRIIRLFVLIAVCLGVFARLYAFSGNPPGLNQDEASIGYESWSLANHGLDRNGVSWPVQFISWGDGQNVLYAWLAMPLIKLFGLSITTTRLPMLISGLATLPLVYRIGSGLFGPMAGLGALLFVALSPWHIMLSRWALESNILPFVFVAGLAWVATMHTVRPAHWFAACACWALCLYAYGTAYLSIPIFAAGAVLILLGARALSVRTAALGLVIFALVALPIVLYVAVNALDRDSIVFAGVTIPHMPATARFASQLNLADALRENPPLLAAMLASGSDGYAYNSALPYGILYSPTFLVLAIPLIIVSVVFALSRRWQIQRVLIALWVIACLPTGLVQTPNINRTNLMLLGLVVAAGILIGLLEQRRKGVMIVFAAASLIGCSLFLRDYVTVQRDRIAPGFFDGLVPALELAQSKTAGSICVTGNVNMPYIYALFTEQTAPRTFQDTVKYASETSRTGFVASFGRYTFGLERCDYGAASVIVARTGDNMPGGLIGSKTSFGQFDVIVLK